VSAPFWGPYSKPRTGCFDPENETKNPIIQMDGWAPGSVWTGIEKRKSVTPTAILTPKRPFRGETLTRKQETFYPVEYTHRPTALSEVSRKIQGEGNIICAELFSLFYFRIQFFLVKNLICFTLNKCFYSTFRSS